MQQRHGAGRRWAVCGAAICGTVRVGGLLELVADVESRVGVLVMDPKAQGSRD